MKAKNLDKTNKIFWRIAVLFLGLTGIALLARFAPALFVAVLVIVPIFLVASLVVLNNNFETAASLIRLTDSDEPTTDHEFLSALETIRSRAILKRDLTVRLIIAAFTRDNFVLARKYIRRLGRKKNNLVAYYVWGLIEQIEGKHSAAIELFSWCLEQEYSVDATLSLVSSYCASESYEKAEFHLFEVLGRDSEKIDCFYYLGLVYERMGRTDDAHKYFKFYLDSMSDEKRNEVVEEIENRSLS